MVDDALLHELAARHGTPLYVYDLDAVRRRVRDLRGALPEAELRYAVKANPNGALLRALATIGVGAEVITLGELERALHAGIPSELVLVGGPGQTPALIARAAEAGVGLVSLDAGWQADAWRTQLADAGRGADATAAAREDARFLVRVNPGFDPGTHPHLATGAADAKFGLPAADAHALATRLQADGMLAGFHVHAGSMIAEPAVHAEVLRRLTPLLDAFPEARTLDLGGGFAVPSFPLAALAEVVRPVLRERRLRLIVEPGRWLVAEAGVLLTRVLAWKRGAGEDAPAIGGRGDGSQPPGHWIADAGMAELLRPALYGAEHPIRVVGGEATTAARIGAVEGPLCENADRLGANRRLAATPGALLAVERSGAYGFAMASQYASSLRPAEVVVEDGRTRLARKREQPADLWRDEL